MLGAYALNASLSLLLEVGMEEVERRLLQNSRFLIEHLSRVSGLSFLSPTEPGRHAGIVTFKIEGIDCHALQQALMKRGVICAYRGGGIRFSPHFYTPEQTLTTAVEILRDEWAQNGGQLG